MKLFIKNIFAFLILIVVIHLSIYSFLNYIHSNIESDSKSIFIYGDSQTLHGINLKLLKEKTDLNVYSAARHGAGIYDFNVFIDKTPNNSKVILSISKLSQIRPNINESNTSPLNVNALYNLAKSNYGYSGFKNILVRGIKFPRNKYYKIDYELFPNNDSIIINQPISVFKSRYSTSKNDMQQKQKMYLSGIERLINKGCHITFIEFPLHEVLKEVNDNSRLKEGLINFNARISNIDTNLRIDTINLPPNTNYMYDYSHLNQHGTTIITEKIIEKFKEHKYTGFYIFK